MQHFVDQQQPDRSGNHQTSRPGNNRAQVGAKAKVLTNGTATNQKVPFPTSLPARGHSGSRNNFSAPLQQSQPRHLDHDAHVTRDVFDTDADSIDTTQQNDSVLAEDTQTRQHATNEQYDEEGEDGSEVDDGEEFDEGAEGDQYSGGSGHSEHYDMLFQDFARQGIPHNEIPHAIERMQKQGGGMMFNEGISYPTTTSGNLSQTYNGENGDAGSEDPDDQAHVPSSSRRLSTQGQPRFHPTVQPLQRPASASGTRKPLRTQDIYHRNATINLQTRNAQAAHPNQVDNSENQKPTHNQGNRNHNAAAPLNPNVNHTAHDQTIQAGPQRGSMARTMSTTKPNESIPSIEKNASAGPPVTVRPPSPRQKEHERSATVLSSGPVEDYDLPNLFDMDYETLKNEDFDTVPRASSFALPEEMRTKSLPERLEHVKKNNDPSEQAKFLSSLPTTEWEDAGDWFLEQFADIIKRTKEARQAKRKLAQGFEAEVEKRHQHVTKKRKQVETALQNMNAQGQGLIPKSPGRSSKSPARR